MLVDIYALAVMYICSVAVCAVPYSDFGLEGFRRKDACHSLGLQMAQNRCHSYTHKEGITCILRATGFP